MDFKSKENSTLVQKVQNQIESLSADGLYIDSNINDLSKLSFAFPDISDDVTNFTLEECCNRKNWGFFASAHDNNDNNICYYAQCRSVTKNYEIIASSIEPQRYYIYNNGSLVGELKDNIVIVGSCEFGEIIGNSSLDINSKVVLQNNKFKHEIPLLALGYKKSKARECWETLSMSWLKPDTKSNKDFIFTKNIFKSLNEDQRVVVFIILLMYRSFLISITNAQEEAAAS